MNYFKFNYFEISFCHCYKQNQNLLTFCADAKCTSPFLDYEEKGRILLKKRGKWIKKYKIREKQGKMEKLIHETETLYLISGKKRTYCVRLLHAKNV